MKKSTILFITAICLFAHPLSIFCQKKPKNAHTIRKMGEEAMSLHLSGFAPLDFVGGKFGTDIPIRIVEKRGFKGFHAGRNFRELYINAELGWQHKQNAYDNFSASVELMFRRVSGRNGWFWQVSPLGVGGNYVMPPLFKDSVGVPKDTSRHALLGRKLYVTPSVSIGFGRDFALSKGKRSGLPLVIYGKIGLSSMLPYKTFGYLVPTAELGLGYRFSGLAIATRQVRRG
jgi:hypothetical protein